MRIFSLASAAFLCLNQGIYAEDIAELTPPADIDWEPVALTVDMFNEQVV